MVVTDCEINVQRYIPDCAPVAHPVPKHTNWISYPYEDTALIFICRADDKSLCSNPAPTLSCLTIYLTKSQSKCNKDCRTVLTGTSYPNKAHFLQSL